MSVLFAELNREEKKYELILIYLFIPSFQNHNKTIITMKEQES